MEKKFITVFTKLQHVDTLIIKTNASTQKQNIPTIFPMLQCGNILLHLAVHTVQHIQTSALVKLISHTRQSFFASQRSLNSHTPPILFTVTLRLISPYPNPDKTYLYSHAQFLKDPFEPISTALNAQYFMRIRFI